MVIALIENVEGFTWTYTVANGEASVGGGCRLGSERQFARVGGARFVATET